MLIQKAHNQYSYDWVSEFYNIHTTLQIRLNIFLISAPHIVSHNAIASTISTSKNRSHPNIKPPQHNTTSTTISPKPTENRSRRVTISQCTTEQHCKFWTGSLGKHNNTATSTIRRFEQSRGHCAGDKRATISIRSSRNRAERVADVAGGLFVWCVCVFLFKVRRL